MLNLPIPLDGSIPHELMVGLLYGFALAATLTPQRGSLKGIRANRTGPGGIWSEGIWSKGTRAFLVMAGGYMALVLSQLFGLTLTDSDHMGDVGPSSGLWTSDWTLSRTWVLAVLVCATNALNGLCGRLESSGHGARQFTIADLLATLTACAILVALLRYTSLVQRGPVFWVGMVVITSMIPVVLIGLRVDSEARSWVRCGLAVVGATLLVVGLAWAESDIAQRGKISYAEAAVRYGCLVAAMIAPRLIGQSIAAATGAGAKRLLQSVVDPFPRRTPATDCLKNPPDDYPDTSPMLRSEPRRTDTTAAWQAQRHFDFRV